MSPGWQVAVYAAAIVLFVLAALGASACRILNLGWLGVALVTLVLLAGAVEAL